LDRPVITSHNVPVHLTALDLITVMVGSLFVAIGAVTAAIALSARPRVNRTAGWFSVFCLLYGLRLLADAEPIQVVTALSTRMFDQIDAGITYTILVPATLFVESLVGDGRHALLKRTWQVLAACASCALVTDLVTGRPYAAMAINVPLVVGAVAVWFAHIAAFARRRRWSTEARWITAAAALLAATAIYETIFDRGLFGRVDAEPLAMLVFSATLGWFVLIRSREQETSYAALSRELELARTIQQSLVPQRMPEVAGLRFAGAYLPMSAVAGDFYEILPLDGHRALVIVADVSGHGVPAALIASMVKVAVAAEADRYDTPGEILTGINRALTGKFEQAYITACCVVFEPRRGRLRYALAGHPPPLLVRRDGGIERLDRGSIFLTFMPSAQYETVDVPFQPDDRLVMYTDGLTEARHAGTEEFFGDQELDRILVSSQGSDDLLRAVLDGHRRWIGADEPLSDDISIVVIEGHPAPDSARRTPRESS